MSHNPDFSRFGLFPEMLETDTSLRDLVLNTLVTEYLRCKDAYYAGEPVKGDHAFDRLEIMISVLEPAHPCLSIVGTPTGKPAKHPIRARRKNV